MTTQKTRREQEFEAFKKAWEEYPSQDNEGFVPDRGGFKCGWFAALRWADSTPQPQEGDELKTCVGYMDTSEFSMMINENPNGGFKWEFLDFLDPKKQEGEVTKIFISTTDPSLARRAQNAEETLSDRVERLRPEIDAEKLRLENNELRALLERAIGFMNRMGHPWDGKCISDHYPDKQCDCGYEAITSDYAKLKLNAASEGGRGNE